MSIHYMTICILGDDVNKVLAKLRKNPVVKQKPVGLNLKVNDSKHTYRQNVVFVD